MSVFWFLILAGVVCVNSTFPDIEGDYPCFVLVVDVSEALLEKWYGCHEESILVPLQKCAELATALIFFNFSLGFFLFFAKNAISNANDVEVVSGTVCGVVRFHNWEYSLPGVLSSAFAIVPNVAWGHHSVQQPATPAKASPPSEYQLQHFGSKFY